MASYTEKSEAESHTNVHTGIKDQTGEMVKDIQGEVKHEIEDIHAAKEPVDPSHSDHVVRRHVAGLSISFFVMIAVFLLIVIAGIAIYTSGHH